MYLQKPYKPEEYKSLIEKNFSEIWFQFLYFEVMRSRDCVRFLKNNPNGYLILQVISWHHGLVLLSENKNQDRKTFVKSWEESAKSKTKPDKKLTYSLVSELTGLSIETIRRQVKKLINTADLSPVIKSRITNVFNSYNQNQSVTIEDKRVVLDVLKSDEFTFQVVRESNDFGFT